MTLAQPYLIPLIKPWLTELEAKAAFDVVMSGQVLQGPRVASFETSFSTYTGASHALAVCNGTAAIILALMASGVRAGDVVLTVSHSYMATANAVRACGAEPILLDIEKDGFNLDYEQLKRVLESDCDRRDGQLWYRDLARLTQFDQSPLHRIAAPVGRVAAILAVHQIGMPCDIVRICSIASQFNLPVIEDAACAVGSKIRIDGQWEPIGRPRGTAATFSFHPRKLITTGDGGMITTANPQMHEHMRLLRQHGMAGIPGSGALSDVHLITGFNYRLSDIQAAIGELQLSRLDEQIIRRRQLVDVYRANLKDQDRFTIQAEPEGSYFNWQSLPIRFDLKKINQGPLLEYLAKLRIMAKPGIMNAHEEPPYAGLWHLPNSEMRKLDTIFVPLFHSMTEEDVARVSTALTGYQT
jgi:dTDP-4-amino-4,6-dideoxygalactose transaminase